MREDADALKLDNLSVNEGRRDAFSEPDPLGHLCKSTCKSLSWKTKRQSGWGSKVDTRLM